MEKNAAWKNGKLWNEKARRQELCLLDGLLVHGWLRDEIIFGEVCLSVN